MYEVEGIHQQIDGVDCLQVSVNTLSFSYWTVMEVPEKNKTNSICGFFVLQYPGYYGSNPHKIGVLDVKTPCAFHEFQTPSCLSTELHASSSDRLHNFL